jgi:GT2 family glycosyltransferase
LGIEEKLTVISVVIPTFNRAEILKHTLPSYLASDLVSEVILVDDAASEDSRGRLEAMAAQNSKVIYVRNKKNLGAPASRNRGIDLARESILLLSEDDLELADGYLETLVEHMGRTQADIISGRRLWMRVGETKEAALRRTQKARRKTPTNLIWLDHNSHVITPDDLEVPLLDGTMLMRRAVVEKVRYHLPFGGPSTWREESDFQFSALEQGFKIVFCPHVVSFHHARHSASFGSNRLMGNLHYISRIHRNNLLFLARHRDFISQHYPQAIILGSIELTSLLYVFRRSFWLARTELLRWYLSRSNQVFKWK